MKKNTYQSHNKVEKDIGKVDIDKAGTGKAEIGEASLISMDEILGLLHENAENDFKHTTYREESKRFHLLMQGNPKAVEESDRMCDANIQGKLSNDPIRNMRYLVIVNTGLASRYVIESGVPQEQVYAVSDLYIQKADVTNSIDELKNINHDVWKTYVRMVQEHKNEKNYSKPIMFCLDYIDTHFNEKITLASLAEMVNLSPYYLAVLFKKEKGETFGTYLTHQRVSVAKALLSRTEYTYSQIAYSLGFCSQSHFIKSFKNETGLTPKIYRMQYYNANISPA